MNTLYHLLPDGGSAQPGLIVLKEHLAKYFSNDGRNIQFEEEPSSSGFCITSCAEQIHIRYSRPCDAFRALGVLLSVGDVKPGESLAQSSPFQSVGVMLDVSRNGIFTVPAIESLLGKFALMGINTVQLYMEDMFVLPGEPFFGYGRGAYSFEELRNIDSVGHQFGIEVIPCIQTLGHLEQVLQWPAYEALVDVRGVLLAGEEKTYALIGKILDMAAACFRTDQIHIGMDEAHGVGTGKYLSKNGCHRPFDILNRHLEKVVALCRNRKLKPMIWSVMYFRIGSKTNDYYDKAASIPAEVIAKMSPDADLVYWDYYHADPAFYEEWIRRHRAMGKEPIFAAGAWTWGRFWSYAPRWKETLDASMSAAGTQHLRHAFITAWGDDGTECHPFSILPAIQYFAEWAYVGKPDAAALDRQFAVFSCGPTLAECLLASQLDEQPGTEHAIEREANFSKWILWHDPVLGFLNRHISPILPGHYRSLADQFRERVEQGPGPLDLPFHLARTLAAKSRIHLELHEAYRQGNREKLEQLLVEVLPETQQAIRKLQETHRAVWKEWYKPFGWEVLDRRYGGIATRLETLKTLLQDFLAHKECRIPEFEMEPFFLYPEDHPEKFYFDYGRSITPSAIK